MNTINTVLAIVDMLDDIHDKRVDRFLDRLMLTAVIGSGWLMIAGIAFTAVSS